MKLPFISERIQILQTLEGEDTDSHMKGLLLFRNHSLLVAKVSFLQRKNMLNEKAKTELGTQLGLTFTESARILHHDQACPPPLLELLAKFSKV